MGLPSSLRLRRAATDPAGTVWAGTQPEPGTLMRLVAAQFFIGAALLGIGLVLPTDNPSDRPYLLAIAVVVLISGALLWWVPVRRQAFVDAGIAGLVVLVTAAVMVSRPMGLTPLFYFWPLMLAAYYASPGRIVAFATLAIVLFGVAVATVAQTENPPLEFILFAAMTTVVVLGVRRLRTRNIELFTELERLAWQDSLTGALNRGGFERALRGELDAARATGRSAGTSLLMLDVDHFKAINDTHGHAGGDDALRSLSQIIRSILTDAHIFGRVGGEEFGIVLPGESLPEAVAVAERIRIAIAERSRREVAGFTVSIGVATALPGSGESSVWVEADRALYRAKRAGRNRTEAAAPLRAVDDRAA